MKVKDAVAAYQITKKSYTYQDYLDLPEDGNRYEIINGELIMVAAPITFHQVVSGNIEYELRTFVKNQKCGFVFDAPIDVKFSESNIVQPDILYVSNKNQAILTENNISGAPDLIIEILSQSTAYYDLVEKKQLYERFEVSEYWIVDPKKQWIENYILQNGKYGKYQRLEKAGKINSKILPGWELDWQTVFEFNL